MTAVVAMKFRETKFRWFYRATIIPQVLPDRKGEVKKEFEEELAGHLKAIREHGLQAELEAYQLAREDRQAAYDAYMLAKSVVNQSPSEENGQAVDKTHAAFEASKASFAGAYT